MSRLQPGETLGDFEILDMLGSGGMGEVYRARDNTLGREVAVKVLHTDFADNPERMARFMREARALASLEHPNVASIYAVEQRGDTPFLVMELASGETLDDRIDRGPVAVKEALPLLHQLVVALEAAHGKGIVHRDLKPANIQIGSDGKVTVLDFGLAKIVDELHNNASEAQSESPTDIRATQDGVILGTASYMSPEQARGRPIDHRTDNWAFGCVVYETLTGEKAFNGETTTDILAAVVRNEPDWSKLPPTTPPSVRRLLARCLDKDVERRLQAIGDARLELEEAASGDGRVSFGARWPSLRFFPVFVGGVLAGGLVIAVAWMMRSEAVRPPPGSTARLSISLASGVRSQPGWHVDISPDGSLVSFTGYASTEDKPSIYLRPLDRTESRRVQGTEGGRLPFFSPDGKWLGFLDGKSVKKVSTEGGPAITLGEAGDLRLGVTWGPDGFIYFPHTYLSGIVRISSMVGGDAFEPVTTLSGDESAHYWPDVLPRGNALLYTSYSKGSMNNCEIHALDLATGESKLIVEGGYNARYVASGHILYGRAGALMAVPFDPDRLQVIGDTVSVVDPIHTVPDNGTLGAAFSDNGTMIYVEGDPGDDQLVWVDHDGTATPAHDERRVFEAVRLGPDGRQVAGVVTEGIDRSIWLFDLERGGLSRLTFGEDDIRPAWSPDGQWVFFTTARRGPYEIFRVRADGSSPAELFRGGSPDKTVAEVSPDGKLLAYVEDSYDTGYDIVVEPIDRSSEPIGFLRTTFWEESPTYSPDGAWIAYQSDDSGRYEIYIRRSDGQDGKTLVSTVGGTNPVWSPAGDRIYYSSSNRMVAVPVRTSPRLELEPAQILFDAPNYRLGEHIRDYDVAREGDRLLMIETKNPLLRSEITVVLNWFNELERLVPATK